MCNRAHDCSRETNIEHGPIFFIFVLSFVELLVDNFLMDRGVLGAREQNSHNSFPYITQQIVCVYYFSWDMISLSHQTKLAAFPNEKQDGVRTFQEFRSVYSGEIYDFLFNIQGMRQEFDSASSDRRHCSSGVGRACLSQEG